MRRAYGRSAGVSAPKSHGYGITEAAGWVIFTRDRTTIRLWPAGVRLSGHHGRHDVADAHVCAVRPADALCGADHDRHLRDVCGWRAVRAVGVRALVGRDRQAA